MHGLRVVVGDPGLGSSIIEEGDHRVGVPEAGDGFKVSKDKSRLVIHRSIMLTKFFIKILEKELNLPKPTALLKELTKHYCAEVEFENELGKHIWRKKSGSVDDLLFCSLFAFVAFGYFFNQAELKI